MSNTLTNKQTLPAPYKFAGIR